MIEVDRLTKRAATNRPLAELIAGHGLRVLAPDWNSHADDGGRADLLHSVDFARARAADPDEIVLVGWSLGGVAAAALAIHASRYGLRFARTVCLPGAFMVPDPITGKQPAAGLPDGRDRCPFSLLHGTYDDVIPIPSSRDLAAVLRRNNWPVELVGLAADHGSIAGASYDRVADRYAAADDDDRLAVAADVAAHIGAVH